MAPIPDGPCSGWPLLRMAPIPDGPYSGWPYSGWPYSGWYDTLETPISTENLKQMPLLIGLYTKKVKSKYNYCVKIKSIPYHLRHYLINRWLRILFRNRTRTTDYYHIQIVMYGQSQ